ncbi:MAG TPA: prolyl oligopeptidase family serine peptidase [Polyangiaceae bacterium]
MTNKRAYSAAWHRRTLAVFPLGLALSALACSNGPEVGPGSGGTPSNGGSVPNTGGAAAGSNATGGSRPTVAGANSGDSGGAPSTVGGSSAGGAISGAGGRGGTAGTTQTMGGMAAGGVATGGRAGSGATAGGGASSGAGGSAEGRSAGCGKTSTVTFGQVPGESGQNVGFGTGGYVRIGNRGFAMRLPDNYDNNKPYWLIFGFHWNGGNSKEVDTGGTNGYNMAHFGLQKLSKNGAIFVAPDGLNAGWANSNGQDLKFVDDMVKLIQDNYCVDTTRLYANGFSYGGGMSYAIACARAKVFRGVAIYNGAVLSGCEGGNDPIAYWQMAGLTDNICTIGAGRTMRDRFVKNNGCTAQSPPEPPAPPPFLSPGGHVCTTYQGCSSKHPVRWCAHQSGHGNAVVDGTAELYNSCATAPKSCSSACPCTWVPDDVWSFFTSL